MDPRVLLSLSVHIGRRRLGFTLFELLVVVVVLSAVAAAVALSMQGPLAMARMEHAAEELVLLDSQLRSHARRSGQGATVLVSPGSSTVLVTWQSEGDARGDREVFLGRGLIVRQVLVPASASRVSGTEIIYSADGQTPTYALQVTDGRGNERWLAFAGITGQQLEASSQQELEQIFDALVQRSDAD